MEGLRNPPSPYRRGVLALRERGGTGRARLGQRLGGVHGLGRMGGAKERLVDGPQKRRILGVAWWPPALGVLAELRERVRVDHARGGRDPVLVPSLVPGLAGSTVPVYELTSLPCPSGRTPFSTASASS